jgi:hypothetical protein
VNRKEFIEIATRVAEVYGDLDHRGVINASDAIQAISDCIVDALNDGYNEITQPLSDYSTEELYEELRKRSEVSEFEFGPEFCFEINDHTFAGPIGVLVVKREEQAK